MRTTSLLLLISLMMTVACTRRSAEFNTETITLHDSTEASVTTLTVELPTGSSDAETAIRHQLIQRLHEETRLLSDNDSTLLFPPFNGNKDDIHDCVNYYGQKLFSRFNTLAVTDGTMFPWECRIAISKVYQTKSYVVFRSENYLYLGGAHGGVTGAGPMTFSLKTGEQIMPFFTPHAQATLQDELRKGLLSYFHQYEPDLTEEAMMERLFIEDGIIPMPKYEPEPTEEGLRLIYQQYEIAPYSEGMPQFVLPYNVVEPVLTPQAQATLFPILF